MSANALTPDGEDDPDREQTAQPQTTTPSRTVGRAATRRDASEGSKRLPSRSKCRLRAWCSRFSTFNATVAPVSVPGCAIGSRRLLHRASASSLLPRDRGELTNHHHAAPRFRFRPARSLREYWYQSSRRLFLNRWEYGRWPPSTIKQITGCAYGFRYADPPFFCLIAASARPFTSHQE